MIGNTAMEVYVPQHLKLWKHPRDYMGAHWDGWYVFLSRTRDSDNIDISNFEKALEYLGGDNGCCDEGAEEGVITVEETHWGPGWVRWIAIHQTAYDRLRQADELAERLQDYPVLDDEDLSRRDSEDQYELIKQEFHFFCNHLEEEEEPTEDETEYILSELCQQQNDFDSCPTDAEMQEVMDTVRGHLLKCPRPIFGGHYLDSERCPCGRFHFRNWLITLYRRMMSK